MLIQDLFNSQLQLSSEILTTDQETNAFNRASDLFFSVVSPIHEIEKSLALEQDVKTKKKFLLDELGLGIGTFKINRVVEGIDYTFIKIEPLDYDDFQLEIKYREDYRLVSSYIIKEISTSNLDVLKGVGIEQTELQNQTYQEILEGLRLKYNTETGNTIVGEVVE